MIRRLTYTLVLSSGRSDDTLYTPYPCPAVVLSSFLRSWIGGGGSYSACIRVGHGFARRKKRLLIGGRGL